MKKLSMISILSLIVISSIGVFSMESINVDSIINIFGEEVQLYGRGIYGYEALFRAGILIGTDIVMLFIVSPLFLVLILRKQTITNQILLLGILGVVMYYSLVTVLSIRYNQLYLLYVILFASTLYHFIYLMVTFPYQTITNHLEQKGAPKGLTVYLIFTGLSVFVWLLEIITNIIENSAPVHIGTLHTEPTYLIDLAIITPTCFIARYLIKNRNGLGIVLANVMAIISIVIGVIVISQSSVQWYLGVLPEIEQVIIFVASFCVLSVFSTYYVLKMRRLIQ